PSASSPRARLPLEDHLAPSRRDDPRHYRQWRARHLEPRALLDVQLDEEGGPSRTRRAQSRRPDTAGPAAPLLLPERNDPERPLLLPDRRDRLQPADHSERPVEPAAVGNRVQMRARPDLRQLWPPPPQPPEEVLCLVSRHLEPGLAHPAGHELVRLVLLEIGRASCRERG